MVLWAPISFLHRRPSRNYFFPHRGHCIFHFNCPDRLASWAGSRAATSVSVSLYVFLLGTRAWTKNSEDDLIFGVFGTEHFSHIPPRASTPIGVYLHSSLLIFFRLNLLWRRCHIAWSPLGAILIRVIHGEFILF